MKPGKSHPLLLLAVFVIAQGFVFVAEAQAQRSSRTGGAAPRASSGSYHAGTSSHRVPHRRGPATRSGRSLISPGFGSAANARPGFYNNSYGQKHRGGHHVPVVIYPIYTEPYYPTGPVVYTEPVVEPIYEPAPAPAPAPAPPPVYIIQPQPIAAPPVPAPVPQPPASPPAPRSTEPGEVQFSILPADADVYFDDDYLGTGAELADLEGQEFSPGVHVIEVIHPDYRSQRLVFGVSPGEPAHVLIDLSIDRIGRRSRVK